MTMVITSRLLPLKKQAAYSDYLVNFQRAQPSKSGQFSVRGNSLFEEIYPVDARSMSKHYQFYQEKNKKRRIGKPLYFPNPAELLYGIAASSIKKISKSEWSFEEAESRKKAAIEESKLEQEKKNEKYRENNISTQEVTPPYVIDLIGKYWKESRYLQRLYIAQECSKYKSTSTIIFFRQVLFGENDWFIKNAAFRTLQRFDEVVYLPQKGRGDRKRYNTLVDVFGCDYKGDIGKGPVDIMKEFYGNNYIQTLKDFDVFISHSVSDARIVDAVVRHLNDLKLVAFVDWKSDKDDLNRSKTDQHTPGVLQLRMKQSKCLLLIRTRGADSSIWVSWELGYYAALDRKMVVLEVGNDLGNEPEFIRNYPKAFLTSNGLHVVEAETRYEFIDWLNGTAPRFPGLCAPLAHQTS
jgi:hypothetical protein